MATFGDTNWEDNLEEGIWSGNIVAFRYTLTEDGDVTQMSIKLKTTDGEVRLAVYDLAKNLMGESASVSCVAGQNDIAVSASLTAADYYLALQVSHASQRVYYETGGLPANYEQYRTWTYGAFPNPMGDTTNASNEAAMYATYTPSAPSVKTRPASIIPLMKGMGLISLTQRLPKLAPRVVA